MKLFVKHLMIMVAIFGMTREIHAQVIDSDEYAITEYSSSISFGTRKYLTSTTPNADGEYTLRIENFLMKNLLFTPTDIALVIDGSGSMMYDYLGGVIVRDLYDGQFKPINECTVISIEDGDKYLQSTATDYWPYCGFNTVYHEMSEEEREDEPGKYQGTGAAWINTFQEDGASPTEMTRFYKYNWTGEWAPYRGYYRIFHEQDTDNLKYLYIKRFNSQTNSPAGKRYLWINDVHENKTGYGVKHNNTIIAYEKIYRLKTRKAVLVEGVKAFLHQIAAANEMEERWGDGVVRNQVAIVGFSFDRSDDSLEPYTGEPSNATKVIKGFGVVDSNLENQFETLYESAMDFTGNTFTHVGINLAKRLLENLQEQSGMEPITSSGVMNRAKVVVVFTDGEPNLVDNRTDDFYEVVSPALEYAVDIKKNGWNSTINKPEINAKIYTIDLANTPPAKLFLQHLSSDYPEGRATINIGEPDTDPTHYSGTRAFVDVYYKDANNNDLVTVFREIAEASTSQNLTSPLVSVDKLSSSFLFPSGVASSGKIRFYTAEYLGKTTDGHLSFASEVPVPNRGNVTLNDVDEHGTRTTETIDIDNAISFIVPDGRTIAISGFDYNKLWCGEDVLTGEGRGFKLITEFPIITDGNAIGGNKVFTNEDTSGLYFAGSIDSQGKLTGDPLAPYERPTLSIPVNLVIQKTGLKVGESASFTIQRKLASSSTATYVDYTSFILTGDLANTPEAHLLNLDPAYHYRVKETGWSWSYTSDAMTAYPSTEDPMLSNPIIIANSPKDTELKHAEAKATNVLKNN